MNCWIDPGIAVLQGLAIKRHRVIAASDDAKEIARRQRKLVREKLWDLKNPGRRRSYDYGLRERVKRWAQNNPAKVKAARRKYSRSERGRLMERLKSQRYRARKKARAST